LRVAVAGKIMAFLKKATKLWLHFFFKMPTPVRKISRNKTKPRKNKYQKFNLATTSI
jgi:hypothetical protein